MGPWRGAGAGRGRGRRVAGRGGAEGLWVRCQYDIIVFAARLRLFIRVVVLPSSVVWHRLCHHARLSERPS